MDSSRDEFRASSALVAPSTLVWFMTLIPGLLGGVMVQPPEVQRFFTVVNARRATAAHQ